MAQNITLLGASYSDVPAVDLPKTGGGTARFLDATTFPLTKLATKDLGTISTSSTSATDTGQTLQVSGINDYDMLIAITHTATHTNNRHFGTICYLNLGASSTFNVKTGIQIATSKLNYQLSSGNIVQRAGTTAYGVYINSATNPSDGKTTLTIYTRYNSTSTGTINGSYTLDVYGVKLLDLL